MNLSEKKTVSLSDPKNGGDPKTSGKEMYQLITELYPICRSITGNGLRETLTILRRHIPLEIIEVPTGTKVFDWTVPKEWNIRDAYLKNANGERVIDFQKSNLHVLNYSCPINKKVSLRELKEHIYTIPDHPDWIPYRTSYYRENWGFCMRHNQFLSLSDEEYEVCIDATLFDGSLTYGELFIPGRSSEEILLSTHVCHPSLCNDNLSGIAIATFLAKGLWGLSLKYSYRILFIPGTIGSITWLSQNENNVSRIRHGLVLACLGDRGRFTYKKSRRSNADIDRSVVHVLKSSGGDYEVLEFIPFGYDERQYCSPGFNLPVGCFMRTPHGQYPEYHTSADNLDIVSAEQLSESLSKLKSILFILDNNATYLNQNPKCEAQLGKRGLYQMVGGQQDTRTRELAMLWVLNLSDGGNSLLDIAERASLSFDLVKEVADILSGHGLLKECP